MALRSVWMCGTTIARAQSRLPLLCNSQRSLARTLPVSLKTSCLCSSSPSSSTTVQEPSPAPSIPTTASDAPVSSEASASADIDALDIRVGRIIKAWKHPEADSLYVEEVDISEPDGPRTICSGLVKYVPLEELEGRFVMVLANLKPRNMRGVKSNGMLLAASDKLHENVELLVPADGSIPGERAWFGTEDDKETQKEAATPNQLQKKKIWESIQPELKTSAECIVTFKGRPMRTSAGMVSCQSLREANVG
ncbi:hypothetical protein KP509_36G033800 [Ceratopteris richardii]|uniref:tRNA-binding domain-containing protein n=1 Tax=Ceratopteris richardii TaxID=49495 RepID=A0A8T2QBY3_CERRI|nr:hypothetical protein KP509_36G033800 [Ceratopteris richardii]